MFTKNISYMFLKSDYFHWIKIIFPICQINQNDLSCSEFLGKFVQKICFFPCLCWKSFYTYRILKILHIQRVIGHKVILVLRYFGLAFDCLFNNIASPPCNNSDLYGSPHRMNLLIPLKG